MTIPISILCKQSENKTVKTKALLDTDGAGGKFIDQTFVLRNELQTRKLEKTHHGLQCKWNKKKNRNNYLMCRCQSTDWK